jgi:hypothetical protein
MYINILKAVQEQTIRCVLWMRTIYVCIFHKQRESIWAVYLRPAVRISASETDHVG